jgi:hypothetical protein
MVYVFIPLARVIITQAGEAVRPTICRDIVDSILINS